MLMLMLMVGGSLLPFFQLNGHVGGLLFIFFFSNFWDFFFKIPFVYLRIFILFLFFFFRFLGRGDLMFSSHCTNRLDDDEMMMMMMIIDNDGDGDN